MPRTRSSPAGRTSKAPECNLPINGNGCGRGRNSAPVSFELCRVRFLCMAKLSIRFDFDGGALGPGKVRVLELVAETGSIRKAAAGMKMSYRKAWLLLQAFEEIFGAPIVATATGAAKAAAPALHRSKSRWGRATGPSRPQPPKLLPPMSECWAGSLRSAAVQQKIASEIVVT